MAQDLKLNNQPVVHEQSKLTLSQSILSGSILGAIEVFVNHPLFTIKTRLQNGEPLSYQPSVLYRGLVLSVMSKIPITASQVGLNHLFQTKIFNDIENLTFLKSMTGAFFSGVGSALICCPTEMIVINKRIDNASVYQATQRLYTKGGLTMLYTGLLATALREGLFTMFFIAVTPMFKIKIKSYGFNDISAALLAGIIAGLGASISSQPFDTIKTVEQCSDGLISSTSCIKNIYTKKGGIGFFHGLIPRSARVVSAVTLLAYSKEKMDNMMISQSHRCS